MKPPAYPSHDCCPSQGGKGARDNSIEWSYRTKVSASFELYEVYIGPLIGLWWTNVVRREDLQRLVAIGPIKTSIGKGTLSGNEKPLGSNKLRWAATCGFEDNG